MNLKEKKRKKEKEVYMKIKEAFVCNKCLEIFPLNEKCPICNSNDISSLYEIYNRSKYNFLLTYSDEDIEELLNKRNIELSKNKFNTLIERIKKNLEWCDCWTCIETALDEALENLKET